MQEAFINSSRRFFNLNRDTQMSDTDKMSTDEFLDRAEANDTPRTDEVATFGETGYEVDVEVVEADFCRTLERELTAALKDAHHWRNRAAVAEGRLEIIGLDHPELVKGVSE